MTLIQRVRLRPRTFRVLPLAALAISFASGVAAAGEFDSARLTGRVTDTAHKPLAGAKVYFNHLQGAPLERPQSLQTRSDQAGRYELTVRFAHGGTLLVTEVFVDLPGYVRGAPLVRLSFKDGQELREDFQLEKGKTLAGVIILPPVSDEVIPPQMRWATRGVTLVVEGENLSPRPLNARVYPTDAEGRFEICLPAGRYKLKGLPRMAYVPTEWPNLEAGQRDLKLTMTGPWSIEKDKPLHWTTDEAGAAFDQFWSAMDARYSYFSLKKDVDWKRLKEEYRPQAIAAKTPHELAAVLQKMLAPLRDLHVFIKTPFDTLPTCASGYAYNGNARVVAKQLSDKTQCAFAIVGKTAPDGFGYFLMVQQAHATRGLVQKAVRAIEALHDAPGFIVDLRKANGGSEPLALEIAKAFCAKETIYAKSKRRNGPAHTDFAKPNIRTLPASKNPYTRPVVCLIGPGAVSSGEGFVQMMRSLPNVTLVGLPTRGASGNPQSVPISGTSLVVFFSTWVDLLPNGEPFEGIGILPEVPVEAQPADYIGADPTLEQGLAVLRKKIAEAPKGSTAPATSR